MPVAVSFGLNHMIAPRLGLEAFFDLAARLGVTAVEIRNDIAGTAILDGTAPDVVRALAAEAGLSIASVNALQRFNHWTPERAREARDLIDYAGRCGAAALVLCPVNDSDFSPAERERLAMLRQSLDALRPMLEEAGVVGLVEPLGFPECSLRLKREAIEAIDAVGGSAAFQILHDTFHHAVAGETEIFPLRTGLVHASGVVDGSVAIEDLRDPHRVLVDERDRIDNLGQIRALSRGGYCGLVSLEPFSASVHASSRIEADLRDSFETIDRHLKRAAA